MKIFKSAIPIWIIILILLSGCATQLYDSNDDDKVMNKIDGERVFGYKKLPIKAHAAVLEKGKFYDIIYVTFPSYYQDDEKNKVVKAWYYRQRDSNPIGNIVQLPILGGDYGPSRLVFEYLADKGFNVLFFERKDAVFNPDQGIDRTLNVLHRTVVDVRRGIDWWLAQPEIDPDKLGILGISMGGFISSLIMAVDARIKAGVFALNGGNLPELLLRTKEGEVVDFRLAIQERFGWDDKEFLEAAQKMLWDVDPLHYAPNLDPAKILHISPRFDMVVPFDLADQWYKAAHKPKRIILPTGHYSSGLFIHYIRAKIKDHFQEVFI